MTNPDGTSHSFLIRLWIEGVHDDSGSIHWRGHITHLIDEDRRYVETFDQIVSFIEQYLQVSAGRAPNPGQAGSSRDAEDGRRDT